MKQASVYLRDARYLIHASSLTTDGLWIMTEPLIAIPQSANDAELGAAVRRALDASRMRVPHLRAWTGFFDPMLRLAGVKTWSAFVRGTSTVRIEEDAASIAIVPSRNLGATEGFQSDESKRMVLALNDVGAIGARIREQLGTTT